MGKDWLRRVNPIAADFDSRTSRVVRLRQTRGRFVTTVTPTNSIFPPRSALRSVLNAGRFIVVTGCGDLFAYVLKVEGQFDPERVHGLMAGYVSPETLQDRHLNCKAWTSTPLKKLGTLKLTRATNTEPVLRASNSSFNLRPRRIWDS